MGTHIRTTNPYWLYILPAWGYKNPEPERVGVGGDKMPVSFKAGGRKAMNILDQARKQAEEHRQESYTKILEDKSRAEKLLNYFSRYQDLNKIILKDYIDRLDKDLKRLSKIDRGALWINQEFGLAYKFIKAGGRR